jgi:hypothetical protein
MKLTVSFLGRMQNAFYSVQWVVFFQKVFCKLRFFCCFACSLVRVLYNMCKRSSQSNLCTAFCIGCKSLHIHHFLCTLQVVDCDELLPVLNAIPMSVCLNRLAMDRTSRPTHVILAHFLFLCGSWLWWWLSWILLVLGVVILIDVSDVVDDRGFMLLVFGGYEVCCISVV